MTLMDIKILITQMTELFLVLFLGYFIFKVKLVDDNFVKKFTKLILNITMPAMILASVLRLEERQAASDVATALIIAAALFFVILPIIGFLLAKLLRVKKAQTDLVVEGCGGDLRKQVPAGVAHQLKKDQTEIDAEPAQKNGFITGSGKIQEIAHSQCLYHTG